MSALTMKNINESSKTAISFSQFQNQRTTLRTLRRCITVNSCMTYEEFCRQDRAVQMSWSLREVLTDHFRPTLTESASPKSALQEATEVYNRLSIQLNHCEKLLSSSSSSFPAGLGPNEPGRSLAATSQEIDFLFVILDDIWKDYMMCKRADLNIIFSKNIANMKNMMDMFEVLRILHMTCKTFHKSVHIKNITMLQKTLRLSMKNLQVSHFHLVSTYPFNDNF